MEGINGYEFVVMFGRNGNAPDAICRGKMLQRLLRITGNGQTAVTVDFDDPVEYVIAVFTDIKHDITLLRLHRWCV
jgi:hypothetical protein